MKKLNMKKTLICFLLLCLLAPVAIQAEVNQATLIHKVFGTRKVVNIGDKDVFAGGYILETPDVRIKYGLDSEPDVAGAVKGFRPSGFFTTLASFLAEGGTETTLSVTSLTLPDGTSLNDSYYGDLLILTIGEGESEEKISVSTLNETTLTFTITDRGHEYGRLATTTANILAHYPGDIVFVSNDDHFLNQQYMDLDSDQTVAGTITYVNYPVISGTSLATIPRQLVTKQQLDATAFSGIASSTEDTIGGIELGTLTEIASSSYSITDPKALHTRYATSTPWSDTIGAGYTCVTEDDGNISADCLPFGSETVEIATTTQWGVFGGLMPTGSITAYATSTAPQGWLVADGSEIASTTYASLFAVIGYTYGGTPGGDFNLPNLNGRNIIGYGSATTTIDTMGETGGEDEHTQSIDEMPSHRHDLNSDNSTSGTWAVQQISANSPATGTIFTESRGGGTAFNVLDPFIVLQYIIKF